MGRTACTEPQCLYKGDLYLLFMYDFKEDLFFQEFVIRLTKLKY